MKKRELLVLLFIFALFLVTSFFITPAGSAADKPIELKVSHFWPQTSPNHEHMLRWKKKLEEDSKGRLTLRVFPSGTLVNQAQEYEGLSRGVADVVMGIRLENVGREFSYYMSLWSMGAPSARTGGQLMYDVYKEFEEYRNEWKTIKVLWMGSAGPTQILCRKPVRRLEDLKGLQIRTAQAGGGIELVKVLGGTPVSMSMSEVFMAIQRATVDGALIPYDALKAFRLTDAARYTTNANLYLLLGQYVGMNWNTYKALPSDLQKVIDDSMEWGREDFWNMWDRIDKTAIEFAKEKKHEFAELVPGERDRWFAAAKPLHDKLAAQTDAKGYPGTTLKEFVFKRIKAGTK